MGAAVSKGHSKDRLVDALASHAAQRSAIYARGTTTPDAAVRAAAMRRAGPLVRLVPDALSGARRGKFLYFLHHEGDLGTFFKPARIGLRYALDHWSPLPDPWGLRRTHSASWRTLPRDGCKRARGWRSMREAGARGR